MLDIILIIIFLAVAIFYIAKKLRAPKDCGGKGCGCGKK